MSGGDDVELLGDLDEDDEQLAAAPDRGARRRPLVVGLAAVLLACAGGIAVLGISDPSLPQVQVGPPSSASTPNDEPWQESWTGRPQAGVVLTLVARVSRVAGGDDPLVVEGVTGPGLTGSPTGPVPVTGDGTVVLRTGVDCEKVPTDLRPQDYLLRLRGGSAALPVRGTVPAGTVASRWAREAQIACSTWFARRDLTVVGVRATPDPHRSVIDLDLSVRNTGTRSAMLNQRADGDQVRVSGGVPLVVPPGGETGARVRVDLERCDTAGAIVYSDIGRALTTDQLGLVASSGLASFSSSPFQAYGAGTEPTGVVVAPGPARDAVVTAVRTVCGAVADMAVLVPGGNIRYDRASRVLTVDLLVDVSPGTVDLVTLRQDGETAAGQPSSGWTPVGPAPAAPPDRTGQATLRLTYRVPAEGPCPGLRRSGQYLPYVADLLLVPSSGSRTVSYTAPVDLSQDLADLGRLCPDASAP